MFQAQLAEDDQYDSMNKRIRYLYEGGNTQFLEMMMTSSSITDLLNKAEYVAKLSSYDRDMLVEFQDTVKTVQDKEAKLQEKYEGCADQSILYIGKAEGERGLRQRLKQYMDYGQGNGNIHAGGQAVWQISDCGLLLLAYEACENAGERERQLLQEYREKNGSYPLANWRG